MSPDSFREAAASEVAPPVLRAVVEALVEGTGARAGWVVAGEGTQLIVRAATGDGTNGLVGRSVSAEVGSAGFVVASGQPIALSGASGDPRLAEGVVALAHLTPGSVVSVPCDSSEGVIGALEAVEKRDATSFTFDDIELASLLARIAAAQLLAPGSSPAVLSPAALANELQRLAEADATRYAVVAGLVEALLGP